MCGAGYEGDSAMVVGGFDQASPAGTRALTHTPLPAHPEAAYAPPPAAHALTC